MNQSPNVLFWLLPIFWHVCGYGLVASIASEPKYADLKIVGSGSYGVVCQQNNNQVIKISDFEDVLDNTKSILEVALFKALNHKAIPKVIAAQVHEGKKKYFEIVMPYYPKSKKENLSDITKDMASVLTYVHGLNIVHRDIKDRHILASLGTSVLIDWGNAEIFAADPAPWIGTTISYRAPEVLLENLSYPKENDLWSLGISLLEIMINKSPLLEGTVRFSILRNIFLDFPILDPIKVLIDKCERGEQIFSLPLQRCLSDQALDGLKKSLVGILDIDTKTRFTAKQLSEELGVDEQEITKLSPPPKTLIFKTDLNNRMRRIAFLWINDVNYNLKFHDKILFEAMSITDRFIEKSLISKNNMQLSVSIALYLSARFHNSPIKISDLVYLADDSFSTNEFINFMMQLLQEADYNLLFNHTMRDFQNELYKEMPIEKRNIVISALKMLEINEHTFTLPNQKKWDLANGLDKSVFQQLCSRFKDTGLAKGVAYQEICKS